MKNFITLLSILLLQQFIWSQTNADLDVLVFSGTYQGQRVYVQNPFDREGVGFSVKHVEVNGLELTGQVFSSAFEIDMEKWHFKLGDSISIHLFYNSEKEPKVINTGSLSKTNSKFKLLLTDFRVENDTILKWSYQEETEPGEFIIEQYRWNKWIKIGEMRSRGTYTKSDYEFVVPEVSNGENIFRIVQFTSSENKLTSKELKFDAEVPPVDYIGNCKNGSFYFSRPTLYQIFDTYGNLVRKGFSDCPKLCGLEKGLYYINYANTTGDVFNVKHKEECLPTP